MTKRTFSIIIVPHDLKRTRNFKVSYAAFYAFLAVVVIGLALMVVFIATYGGLLVKSRESSMYRKQVQELTKREAQMGELRRNLAELRAMNLQVRRMLGLAVAPADSIAAERAGAESGEPLEDTGDSETSMLRAIPTFWPVRGFITRQFSVAPGAPDSLLHQGIDIAVDRGTPVRAAASGYVSEAGWSDVFGYFVQIDHGYGIKTLYAHADMLVVMKGEAVAQGQTIAYSGNTGRSSAPHLHFQVTVNNVPVDPLKYLLQ